MTEPVFKRDFDALVPLAEPSRRTFIAATGVVAGFAAAVQPVEAQTVITTATDGLDAGDTVLKAADGVDLPVYFARPAGGKNLPVVLVVQEIFGVHAYIKDVCRRLARLGCYALAPELYVRQGNPATIPEIPAILRDIVSKVPDAQVLADLDTVVAHARSGGIGSAERLGITGFCWGGRVVWLYAAHNPKLTAGVAWYGRLSGPASPLTPTHPLDLAEKITPPVLGLYGGADTGIPTADVEKMNAALKAAGKPSLIHLYDGAPHAFHADYRPSYRKDAAEDGWARLQGWFKTHGLLAG